MAMVLSLTVLSFADTTTGTYSITINNSTPGHIYEAYQIFTGDLSSKGVLSNIEWGSGITDAGKAALKEVVGITEGNPTAADIAEKITESNVINVASKAGANLTTTVAGSANTITDGKYVINGLAPGYYLVKDQDGSLTGDNDSYTSYILKVVKNITMDPKSDQPTVEKKVKDTNDSEANSTTGWQDSADYDIGDDVPFQLTATLPDNITSYDRYKVIFHDTLSAGLTYNKDAVIKIDGNKVTGFTPSYSGTTLTFSCDDVIALGAHNNSVITIEYTAKLNEKAVLGSAGNPNKVNLEYSNNPNQSGEGDRDTGKTPDDTVIVFTYKTVVNKVDGTGNALTGAEFTLSKKMADGTLKEITVVKNDAGTTFTFSGLDDGDYVLKETKTPEGYNSIADIEFTITAAHDVLSDNPALTSLSGNVTTGEITFTSNTTEGSLTTTVENKSGATLPETGGIGTTIFYVVGAVLVIGAGVLFVTKRRMSTR